MKITDKTIAMMLSRIIRLESRVKELRLDEASRLPSRGSSKKSERSEVDDPRDGGRLDPSPAGARAAGSPCLDDETGDTLTT